MFSIIVCVYQDMQLSESKMLHILGFPKTPETALEVSQNAHKLRGLGLW